MLENGHPPTGRQWSSKGTEEVGRRKAYLGPGQHHRGKPNMGFGAGSSQCFFVDTRKQKEGRKERGKESKWEEK